MEIGDRADPTAEAARTEAWVRLLGAAVPAILWATDRDLRITASRAGDPKVAKLQVEEIGKSLAEYLEGQEPGVSPIAMHRRALEGESVAFDFRRSGRLYRCRVEPLRDASGEIVGCVGAAIDETEREEERARIADMERRHALAQAVARVSSWEWYVDTDRFVGSESLGRILGLPRSSRGITPEPLALQNDRKYVVLKLLVPDDVALLQQALDRVVIQPERVELDLRVTRSDGALRIIHARMERFGATEENGRLVVGTCEDVTEQRGAERAVISANSLLDAALDSTADGLLVVDLEGRITKYNATFATLWRVPQALIALGDDEKAIAFVLEQIADPDVFLMRVHELYGDPERDSYDEIVLKDGRIFERYSQPQRIEGKPVGRVWSFRDVTQRRQAEAARDRLLRFERIARAAAQTAEHRAAFLAEASRLLASLDPQSALSGVANLVSESFADWCAVDLVDSEGKTTRVASAPKGFEENGAPCSAPETTTVVIEREDLAFLGVPLARTGKLIGAIHFARERLRGFAPADLALAEDLAGRAALAVDNARLYLETDSALRAREEFISAASHELRGPLASLQMATDGMLAGAYTKGPLPRGSPLDKPLRSIGRQVLRLSHLVARLLDTISISTDSLELELSPCDLSTVVVMEVERFKEELGTNAATVLVDARAPVLGRWDRRRLDEVIFTLLWNANRYGAGKPIEVTVTESAGLARLTVRDRGVGIASEQLQRVFERFARAGASREYGGLGLGLYVAHAIVSRHGGSIRVESSPGKGSMFTVELPTGPGALTP